MGCDIHLYSESFINGKWVADRIDTLRTPTVEEQEDGERIDISTSYDGDRNYSLFGLLTNGEVRREVSFGLPNQGMPTDASDIIADMHEAWDTDAHSENHLTVKQLKEKAMELMVIPDPYALDYLQYLNGLITGLPPATQPNPEHQRIVFWFDN